MRRSVLARIFGRRGEAQFGDHRGETFFEPGDCVINGIAARQLTLDRVGRGFDQRDFGDAAGAVIFSFRHPFAAPEFIIFDLSILDFFEPSRAQAGAQGAEQIVIAMSDVESALARRVGAGHAGDIFERLLSFAEERDGAAESMTTEG